MSGSVHGYYISLYIPEPQVSGIQTKSRSINQFPIT